MLVRRLVESDWAEFRTVRLEALTTEPEAFGSSPGEYESRPDAYWAGRCRGEGDSFVMGAFAGVRLVGIAGFARESGRKDRHKGMVWGMYITPAHRGAGNGRLLLEGLLQEAKGLDGLEQIMLSVVTTNQAAVGLYRRLGFIAYGYEARALKLGSRYLDEQQMALFLHEPPEPKGPFVTESLTLEGIPLLHIFRRDLMAPAPTILLCHGWGSRKQYHALAAEILAAEGFRVLLPDLPLHGERSPLPDYQTPEAWNLFWGAMMQGIDEAGRVMRAAVAAGLADPAHLGIVGSSAGGMVAAGALVRYDWARAAVLMNSMPSFGWLEDNARQRPERPPMSEQERARLRQYDPAVQPERLGGRPLLMMHGLADALLPIAGVQRFAEAARPLYRDHPERLVLLEIPNLNHHVTALMLDRMREWFRKYL